MSPHDLVEFASSDPARPWKPGVVVEVLGRGGNQFGSRDGNVRIWVGPGVTLVRQLTRIRRHPLEADRGRSGET